MLVVGLSCRWKHLSKPGPPGSSSAPPRPSLLCVQISLNVCTRGNSHPTCIKQCTVLMLLGAMQPLNTDSLHLPHTPTSGKYSLVQNVPELRAGDLGPWSLWILLQVLRADEWPSCRHLRSKSRTTFHHPSQEMPFITFAYFNSQCYPCPKTSAYGVSELALEMPCMVP